MTQAKQLSKAAAVTNGGANTRALIADASASRRNRDAQRIMTAWILDTFTVMTFGPGEVAFLDKRTADIAGGTAGGVAESYCNVEPKYFAAAARQAEGQSS